jgi:hypothetical protein
MSDDLNDGMKDGNEQMRRCWEQDKKLWEERDRIKRERGDWRGWLDKHGIEPSTTDRESLAGVSGVQPPGEVTV